jgi:hypothetical protein
MFLFISHLSAFTNQVWRMKESVEDEKICVCPVQSKDKNQYLLYNNNV